MPRPKNPFLAGKTERIDTRVSPATRVELQKAADANGVSLSREIEERLADSLMREGLDNLGADRVGRETEELLWELRFVIERVEGLTGQPWWSDGFTRDAVADAVQRFVHHFGPAEAPGSSAPPETLMILIPVGDEAVASVGGYCARMTVEALNMPRQTTDFGRQLEAGYSAERSHAKRLRELVRFSSEKD